MTTGGSGGPQRSRGAQEAPQRSGAARPARLRLTARGAIVGTIVVSFGAAMLADAVSAPAVNGVAFFSACVLSSLLVRRGDLLVLSVSPPLAYFTAALAAEIVLTLGREDFVRALTIGIGTRLAEIAPWLFAGTAVVLVVALARGLSSNVRELGDEMSGRTQRRRE
ncbi:DUF6542 domain-containing protein [Salinactinospora qingdaonensis]|uniref:DUF6542 domain-containing protein n=1 Tax=Salinactinospora qingdaonensis TaxID=702744 RepID=UPI0031EDB98A